ESGADENPRGVALVEGRNRHSSSLRREPAAGAARKPCKRRTTLAGVPAAAAEIRSKRIGARFRRKRRKSRQKCMHGGTARSEDGGDPNRRRPSTPSFEGDQCAGPRSYKDVSLWEVPDIFVALVVRRSECC